MMTLFRQFFLMLTVLLTAIGNMNALSFCECSSGIFIGSCACEHGETASADSFENSENLPHSSSVFIGSHHCHHVSLANNDLAQISPFTPAQIVPTPQFTIPVEFVSEHFITLTGHIWREFHDPPNPFLDLCEGFVGYCHPMLI